MPIIKETGKDPNEAAGNITHMSDIDEFDEELDKEELKEQDQGAVLEEAFQLLVNVEQGSTTKNTCN